MNRIAGVHAMLTDVHSASFVSMTSKCVCVCVCARSNVPFPHVSWNLQPNSTFVLSEKNRERKSESKRKSVLTKCQSGDRDLGRVARAIREPQLNQQLSCLLASGFFRFMFFLFLFFVSFCIHPVLLTRFSLSQQFSDSFLASLTLTYAQVIYSTNNNT